MFVCHFIAYNEFLVGPRMINQFFISILIRMNFTIIARPTSSFHDSRYEFLNSLIHLNCRPMMATRRYFVMCKSYWNVELAIFSQFDFSLDYLRDGAGRHQPINWQLPGSLQLTSRKDKFERLRHFLPMQSSSAGFGFAFIYGSRFR